MRKPHEGPHDAMILFFIQAFRDENGFSPTYQEISDFISIGVPTVYKHVQRLVKAGLLTNTLGSCRTLMVASQERMD